MSTAHARTSVSSTHLLSPSLYWCNARLFLEMANGSTQQPVPAPEIRFGSVVKVVLWSRGGAHLTKPGWSKPHTHSNPNNLALFRHKITLYRFNQGGSYYCRGAQMGAGGWAPSPLTLTTGWRTGPLSSLCLRYGQLLEDGTWEDIPLLPMGHPTKIGCSALKVVNVVKILFSPRQTSRQTFRRKETRHI